MSSSHSQAECKRDWDSSGPLHLSLNPLCRIYAYAPPAFHRELVSFACPLCSSSLTQRAFAASGDEVWLPYRHLCIYTSRMLRRER